MTNIDIEKLFDKYLSITTTDDEVYKFEKKNIQFVAPSLYYGERYVITSDNTSDKLNNKNLYILRDIYSLEDNRLRFCFEEYINVKLVNSIEKKEDNSETSILVVEKCADKKVLNDSIGNIRRIDSDKLEEMNKAKQQKKNGIIRRLILRPIDDIKQKAA